MNSNGSIESYLIPERDCGAVGNGSNDDTAAIKTCLESNIKNIVLRGTYLISNNIETYKEKNIFNGNFLIQVQNVLILHQHKSKKILELYHLEI